MSHWVDSNKMISRTHFLWISKSWFKNPENTILEIGFRPIMLIQFWLGHSRLVLFLSSAILYVGAQSNTNQTDPYQYPNFSPFTTIIVVVLVATLFFMGFFSIYIRHYSNSRNGGSVRPVVGGQADGRSRRANRGLDQAVIDMFLTFTYSAVKGLQIGKDTLECAVCLNEFEDGETLLLCLDLDYHRSFRLMEKRDMYIVGVVLLELITGMGVVDQTRDKREMALVDLVVSRIQIDGSL